MAHAVQYHELGAGDGARGGPATADIHQRDVGLELTLSPPVLDAVKGVARTLRMRRPCDDLAIGAGMRFDALDGIGGRGIHEAASLASKRPIPLAVRPNGPARARLVARAQVFDELSVVAREAGWARIAVEAGDVLLVGWVQSAFVAPVLGLDRAASIPVEATAVQRVPRTWGDGR